MIKLFNKSFFGNIIYHRQLYTEELFSVDNEECTFERKITHFKYHLGCFF